MTEQVTQSETSRTPDLRLPVLGVVSWLAALAALRGPGWFPALTLTCLVLLVLHRARRGADVLTSLAWLVAAGGVMVSALVRVQALDVSPVQSLADQEAVVETDVVLTSDPVLRQGRFGTVVVLRARTVRVAARGQVHRVRVPLLILGGAAWRSARLGSVIRLTGRLQPARTSDLAGVLSARGAPQVVRHPGPAFRAAEALRASIRAAVEREPSAPRALVPALVDGDDAGMREDVREAFRAAGLTHLLAVSGTNLTLVLGALLLLARWCGVRARGLVLVGALGVAGFVLLARAEPSVVRAATMGAVGLVGLGQHGQRRGTRALGAAVFLLLLFDPAMAESAGFALSVLATAGILWLAPAWRDRLRRWLPRWVAEAVAVPLAAQLACTPLVAAISGQVSLVSVVANVLAAPAVGPATVLGLGAGLTGLISDDVARLVGAPAAWCASWIILVARRSAELPVAAIGWPADGLGVAVLTALCIVLAVSLGIMLAHRTATAAMVSVMVLVLLVPMPTPGWPSRDWVMVACDVGQGDGLVLNAGAGSAVVVDAGGDPRAIDSCLRRLDVDVVPLVVLTHFHADHVAGLEGVLTGRRVGAVEVTGLAEPLSGVRLVEAAAGAARVPVRRATYGETVTVGALRWQVVAPAGTPSRASASPANDASIVLLVETRGIRILLLGDQEESAQARLLRESRGLRADVVKVAHHGSAAQEPDLLRGLGARLALISVGADNDYGHPAPSLMALLGELRLHVARTDRHGDLAVTVREGRLGVQTRGPGRNP